MGLFGQGILEALRLLGTGDPEVWQITWLSIRVSATATLLFLQGVTRLPQTTGSLHLVFPVLAALFCVTESWRVYIHFRRNAQSYSLSESRVPG